MSEVSSTLTRSISEAARAADRLVERCIDHAVAELQQAESQAERSDQRNELAAAWRALLMQRPRWTNRFPQLLRAAIDADASGKGNEPQAAPTLRPSSLTLVDDTEIAQGIESSRLAQQLISVLERPLAELDALMSSVLGLEGIQPERNPLRPEVYARTLRKLAGEGQPEPAFPGMWLRHMAKPLAQGLEQVYRDQAHLLTLARVQAAGYRLRSTPSRPTPLGANSGSAPLAPSSGAGGFGPANGGSGFGPASGGSGFAPVNGASGPVSASAPLGPRSGNAPLGPAGGNGRPAGPANWSELRPDANPGQLREFVLRGTPQAEQPLEESYYAAIEAEIAAIEAQQDDRTYDPVVAREHMHLPPVDRPARRVATDSPLPKETWGAFAGSRERALVRGKLKKEAQRLGQAYALEVVRKLVDEVAQDPRLLGPLREAIVGLEPSLLRLSMVAPRFFSDSEHPGRQLIERVAERSLHYNDEFSVEFQAFVGPVDQAFQRLNGQDSFGNGEPFRQALATLEASWAAQDELDAEGERKVLDAVQGAERRQREADRIGSEFAQREDLVSAPEEVREFLLRRWSLVVAHARLAQAGQGIDPGGYIAVVSDLLWSVDRERALHDPARAFALIPPLLMKLREGLAVLGEQPEDSETFFHMLERLHRPVMKLRARQRHRELPPTDPLLQETEPAPREERAPEQLWMAEAELQAAGYEEGPGSEPVPLAPETASEQPAGPDPLDEPAADDLLTQLTVGSRVDLFSRQQWRRAKLVWTSENGAFYMFTSHGGRPHSMTRRSLQRLLREHQLRPVASHAVVPRALEAVVQQSVP